MARFRVYQLKFGGSLVVDVQADTLSILPLRVVVPLLPSRAVKAPIARLNPEVHLGDMTYVVLAQSLSAVPVKDLGREVANLTKDADRIRDALDFLFVGF